MDQTIEDRFNWITEDELFDLFFSVCDLLYSEGYVRSSLRAEQLIDEFLDETGKAEKIAELIDEGVLARVLAKQREAMSFERPISPTNIRSERKDHQFSQQVKFTTYGAKKAAVG